MTIQNAQIAGMTLQYMFTQAAPCAVCTGHGAGGFEMLIRQDPDNPCLIQASPDGTTWVTFIDLMKCTTGAGQPSGTQPQPGAGGGQQCYQISFPANSSGLVPTLVNTGDVLEIQSASGAGSYDGVNWWCVDGEQYFGGACIGITNTASGNPVPTAPTMALILQIGTSFHYVAVGSTFVVPSGVSNEQVFILANYGTGGSPTLAGLSGSYQVSVCRTNNAAAPWSHTFDFTASTGGWAGSPSEGGVWTAGTGWVSTDQPGSSPAIDSAFISLVIPSLSGVSITAITATCNATIDGSGASVWAVQFSDSADGFADPVGGVLGVHVYNAVHFPTGGTTFVIQAATLPAAAFGGWIIQSVTFSGFGHDPF